MKLAHIGSDSPLCNLASNIVSLLNKYINMRPRRDFQTGMESPVIQEDGRDHPEHTRKLGCHGTRFWLWFGLRVLLVSASPLTPTGVSGVCPVIDHWPVQCVLLHVSDFWDRLQHSQWPCAGIIQSVENEWMSKYTFCVACFRHPVWLLFFFFVKALEVSRL